MTSTIASLFLFFSTLYLLLLIAVYIGLNRLKIRTGNKTPEISVVIAARNEEQRIRPTLQALEGIDYPQDRYEIIFVDDASGDATAGIIQSFADRHDNWRLIRLESKSTRLKGKKRALKEAIDQARFDLIFTTDADCRVPPDWLRKMSACFDDDTAMVLGHSPLETGPGLWNSILNFDNLFSAIVAAASVKLGFPLTSVGRNLAYRKSAYLQVGGFDALSRFRSGDDVHLTERFRRGQQGRIEYCAHPDTFVSTGLPASRREIFHQQIRKNSKNLQKSAGSIAFSLLVFVIYLLFIFLPAVQPQLLGLWALVMLVKLALEWLVLYKSTRVFQKHDLRPKLIFMQIVYPFYIIFFSLLGSLQIYQWKK